MIRVDLDQLTVAEALPNGAAKVLVAVADVDAAVKKPIGSCDLRSKTPPRSILLPRRFRCCPKNLSTDLNLSQLESAGLAIVIEMIIAGEMGRFRVRTSTERQYLIVQSCLQSVAAWLDGNGPMPQGIGTVKGLDRNNSASGQRSPETEALRHLHGAA